MFDQRFLFVLSQGDRQVLRTLAQQEEMTQSAVLREGLYRLAQERGLQPVAAATSDEQEDTQPAQG